MVCSSLSASPSDTFHGEPSLEFANTVSSGLTQTFLEPPQEHSETHCPAAELRFILTHSDASEAEW
jgi:hypothetical protein